MSGVVRLGRLESVVAMQALSASTTTSDPYRAGVVLGEALLPLSPEVVFLFSSVQFGASSEILEGLYDTLGRDDLMVVGNTGDGIYESERVADFGAAALGLNSGGTVRWSVVHVEGVAADPEGSARSALKALDAALGGDRPAFIYLISDFRTDASRLENVIREETDVPIVGGLAADDYLFADCVLYANREVVRDGIVMLGAAGAIAFDISIGRTVTPIGHPGRIEEVAGSQIRSIDGIGAMDFVQRETGKRALKTDRGEMALVFADSEHPEENRLRAIVPTLSRDDISLALFGGIRPGTSVQVGVTNRDDLVHDTQALVERTRSLSFAPSAAVMVSCAGLKRLLGDQNEVEVKSFAKAYPEGLAIAGFASYGEMAPLRDGEHYTRNMFHNLTNVILLIGSPP